MIICNYQAFRNVFLTVALAAEVKLNPSATIPAYLTKLNLGEALIAEHEALHKKKVYTSSAQLTSNHRLEDIVDKLMLVVLNFPRKQIGKNMSDCLITGVQRETSNVEAKRNSTVFMTPSNVVQLGARVGLLAEDELIEMNPRDLRWEDFLRLDLRIATLEECQAMYSVTESINQVLFRINLGDQMKSCIARLHVESDVGSLIGKQALVLNNLDTESKAQLFSLTGEEEQTYTPAGDEAILCTIGGRVVLEPAIPVDNGFKLA